MEAVHPNYIIVPADMSWWDLKGKDAYTKLLLHCNGADGSTTISDSSDAAQGNATVGGNAQLDTAQKQFGTSSLLLDGNGDYITFADSNDWNMADGAFTIDFWIRTSVASLDVIFEQYVDANNYVRLYHSGGGIPWASTLTFEIVSGGATIVSVSRTTTSDFLNLTWTHIAVIRGWDDGVNNWVITVGGDDGDSLTSDDSTYPDLAAVFKITTDISFPFDTWIDEFRISKGIARWVQDFNPPYGPYF